MTQHLTPTFHALADPTRAAMITRLAQSPASVSDLAAPFGMALPTILAHVKVLQVAGLVSSAKQGRSRIVTLKPEGLRLSADWLHSQATLWEARLDRLDALALSLPPCVTRTPDPTAKGNRHDTSCPD